MYKDDLWYNELTRAVEERKSGFSDKQIKKYQVDFLLRLARRIKDYSDKSETCRSYQHILTRLEEEMGELPESKAQRQYQKKKLQEIEEYFVEHHRLIPPQYYTKKWVLYGVILGAIVGLLASLFIVSNLPLLPLGIAAGLLLGLTYGSGEDSKVKQEGRLI
jgi:hypothetical protein